jgi:hypothetical protein
LSYSWSLPTGWNGSSTTNLINVISGSTTGNIQAAVTNSCGTSQYSSYNVVVQNNIPALNVSTSNQVACVGSSVALAANGAQSYTWQPGNLSGFMVSVTPTANTIYTVTARAVNGCTASATISQAVTLCVTNLNEKTQNTVAVIYPNPFRNKLLIELNEECEVNIYQSLGKVLDHIVLPAGQNTMELKYEPGIYFLQIIKPGGSTSWSRLIKEN